VGEEDGKNAACIPTKHHHHKSKFNYIRDISKKKKKNKTEKKIKRDRIPDNESVNMKNKQQKGG